MIDFDFPITVNVTDASISASIYIQINYKSTKNELPLNLGLYTITNISSIPKIL